MEINQDIKTDKGIATFIGDHGGHSIFIHVSPALNKTPAEANSFSPDDIDVLISHPDNKKSFLGRIPLDHIVDCAVNDGFETEDGSIVLTDSECREIDHLSWSVLTKKYRLVPNQLVL
jgi:hypothetical protein